MVRYRVFILLAALLAAGGAQALSLVGEYPITAFKGYAWPVSRILRHIVFEDDSRELEFHLYKQETTFHIPPDLADFIREAGGPPEDPMHLQWLRDRLGGRNEAWYQHKIKEWISNVERAEEDRQWPAVIVQRIRTAVEKKADQIDYVAVYRRKPHGKDLVATLRRTISAQYFRGNSSISVEPRRSVILEDVFEQRLQVPHEMVRPGIFGGEVNEIGGFWIADGENKLRLSGEMLSLLILLIDDHRIPERFREYGRRWVMFTDRPGHRHFGASFGFRPLDDIASPQVRGKTKFFFDGVMHGELRAKLSERVPCGAQLLAQVEQLRMKLGFF